MAERPEDLYLPLAVISRLINEAIPASMNVSAEARKVICKTASVFILYTTATAGSMATKHNRKTMNATDVIEAIEEMEFPHFAEPLRKSLQFYREGLLQKKATSASRKSENEGNKIKGKGQAAATATPGTSSNTPGSSGSASPKKTTSPNSKTKSPPQKIPKSPAKASAAPEPESDCVLISDDNSDSDSSGASTSEES